MEKKPIINLKQHIRNPIKRKKKQGNVQQTYGISKKKKKKKETKTHDTQLQPNLKKPEHEQQIHQVKQDHLSKKKKKQNQNSLTTTTNGYGNLRSSAKAT